MGSEPNHQGCDCRNVDPKFSDANIAGPGVVGGFILTGSLTVIASYTTLWLHPIISLSKGEQPRLLQRASPHGLENPARFWVEILEDFLLQLSDQQLMTTLVLFVLAYIKYLDCSVICGADSLWHAADVVAFSSLTHATTLLTLRKYFRKHRGLATARVVIMYAIYALWLRVAVRMLQGPKSGSAKITPVIKFWYGAVSIEVVGVTWIYLVTYLPIFLSDDATRVRDAIASGEDLAESVQEWRGATKIRRLLSALTSYSLLGRLNPYAFVRRLVTRFARKFCDAYVGTTSVQRKTFLWWAAELLFPWSTAPVFLGVLWAFSLAALIFSLTQSRTDETWDLGQLLSMFMFVLPIQTLITHIASTYFSLIMEAVH
ncbi:hypothetical protein K469DRAFT_631827 [Zopfia rhizophila CBS 207.26]|uniref:Uncharacterized protein n=1 Tax=Zopfia rhizophila CBS 207.26 TaxID=1314779 RepID=A0A6A6E4M3_9PEZI|nr:hypothetical protein K469DRAFT_631827 [Zopfia rhizophila CBS 207.26]